MFIRRKLGSAIATLSPIITPFPGARLYRLTATQCPRWSVIQNVNGTDSSECTEQMTLRKATFASLLHLLELPSPDAEAGVSSI